MIILHILKKIIYDKWAIVFNSILILLSVIFMMAYFLELDSYTNYKIKLVESFKDKSFISNVSPDEINKIEEVFPTIEYDTFSHRFDGINHLEVFSGTKINVFPCRYYDGFIFHDFIEEIELISGKFFDPYTKDKVIVIDEDEAMKHFGYLNVVGESYYLEDDDEKEISFKVVGVVKNSYRKKAEKERNKEYISGHNNTIYNSIYLPINVYEDFYGLSGYLRDILIDQEFTEEEEGLLMDLLNVNEIHTFDNDKNLVIEDRNMRLLNNIVLIMIPFFAGIFGLVLYLIYLVLDSERDICLLIFLGIKKRTIVKDYFLEYLVRIILIVVPAILIGLAIGLFNLLSKSTGFIISASFVFMLLFIFLIVIPLVLSIITLIPTMIMVYAHHTRLKFERSDFNG